MKVLIKYTEIREYSHEVEVEMTKKEYTEYCKMSNYECEEKLQFCADDIAGHEMTSTNYEFIEI